MVRSLESITQGTVRWRSGIGDATLHRVSYPPGLQMCPHSHENTSVTLVLCGSAVDTAQDARVACESLMLLIKPAGCEHATTVSARGLESLCLSVSPHRACGGVHRALHGRCRWIDDPGIIRSFLAMVHGRNLSVRTPEHLLIDWLRKVESGLADAPDRAARHRCPRSGDIDRVIEESFADSLSVATISETLGLHPTYLARVFRRATGQTISRRIQQKRVSWLAGALLDRGDTIGHLSVEAGFTDHAHATRLFRAYTGLTPSAFRSLFGSDRS